MTALAADRKITMVASDAVAYRIGKLAAVKVYKGGGLCRNITGYIVPAADVRGYRFIGWAAETVDNSAGAAGDLKVKYFTRASVKMINDGTNPIVQATLGASVCYVKDDQTVQAIPSNGVVCGVIEAIEDDGTILVYAAIEVGLVAETSPTETVTAAGAISLYSRTTLLNLAAAVALTLAAGLRVGQRKTIRMISAGGANTGTITGAFTTDGVATTTALFNAAADQLELEWNGTAWQVLYNVSVTLS